MDSLDTCPLLEVLINCMVLKHEQTRNTSVWCIVRNVRSQAAFYREHQNAGGEKSCSSIRKDLAHSNYESVHENFSSHYA